MSGFWAVVWVILKYSLIIGVSFSALFLLILIFHPICISLKGRGSIKGQRGEIKLSYLFGLLRLRYVASPHTQDLWFEFGYLKRLLQRESIRNKVEEREERSEKGENEVVSVSESNTDKEEMKEKIEEEVREEKDKEKKVEKEEVSVSERVEDKKEDKGEGEDIRKEDVREDEKEEKGVIKEETAVSEIVEGEELPKVVATPEQLAELQMILEEEEKAENEKLKKKNDLGVKFKKFKKDFDRRYNQIRKKIRIIKQKWHIFWPILKRFWDRGRKGFAFYGAFLKVKYSLDDYCLTGMLSGYLAPTIGFAKRYDFNFQPIPVFPEQPAYGLYSKVSWNIDIKPYKLIWAVTGLVFEIDIYREFLPILWKKIVEKVKNKFKRKNNIGK